MVVQSLKETAALLSFLRVRTLLGLELKPSLFSVASCLGIG